MQEEDIQSNFQIVVCSCFPVHFVRNIDLAFCYFGPCLIAVYAAPFESKKQLEIEAPVELSGPIFPCHIEGTFSMQEVWTDIQRLESSTHTLLF